MAGPDAAASSSSVSAVEAESSVAAASSSSTSSSPDREEEDYRRLDHNHGPERGGFDGDSHENPELDHRYAGILSWVSLATVGDISAEIRDESLSCLGVIFIFWFLVSMTLILGVCGPKNMRIGPNSSILFELNPFFVQSIKVKQLDDVKPGLKLYGFYKSPPLDVVDTWTQTNILSVPADSHKDWVYYLNEGSSLNISYKVKSQGSSVLLVIAQGSEALSQWLEDPSSPNTTLSWNLINGSGFFQQKIYSSSSYYVAVCNLNTENVKVELDVGVKAFLYDTTESFYKCIFDGGECTFSVIFSSGNSVVLTSRGLDQQMTVEEWYIRFSYQPRWISYIVTVGGLTGLMLLALNFLRRSQCTGGDGNLTPNDQTGSQREPLLSSKDDEGSSMGSSYESVSNDDPDLEEFAVTGSSDGKPTQEGETSNNTRRLCAICFDAPRDCFFLPCGHCASCFECGTRIAAAAGGCPICRRKMKKVKRIYTV